MKKFPAMVKVDIALAARVYRSSVCRKWLESLSVNLLTNLLRALQSVISMHDRAKFGISFVVLLFWKPRLVDEQKGILPQNCMGQRSDKEHHTRTMNAVPWAAFRKGDQRLSWSED